MKNFFSEEYLLENMMGPNCVRILDELIASIDIKSGSKILDLGSGHALTSMYLAKLYDVEVVAFDLWIDAKDNEARIKEQGLSDKVTAIHGDVTKGMPFPKNYFDYIISVDSYHYYGASETFLDDYTSPYLKMDGIVAIAVPGMKEGFDGPVPDALQPFVQEAYYFRSASWWDKLWRKSRSIEVIDNGYIVCHAKAWEEWLQCDEPHAKGDIAMIEADNGRYLDTVKIIGKKIR